MTLLLGVVHVLLSIILVAWFDWGLYGIAASGVITLTLKNSIFTLIHAAILQDSPLTTFVAPVVSSFFAACFAVLACTLVMRFISVDSWTSLTAVAALTGFIYLGFSWFLLLRSDERVFLRDMLLSRG